MEIYHYNNAFPLFRFRNFDMQRFESMKAFKESLLIETLRNVSNFPKTDAGHIKIIRFEKNNKYKVDLKDSNHSVNETDELLVKEMLEFIKEQKNSYLVFNHLITIFPALIFTKSKIDKWELIKSIFVNDLEPSSKIQLKKSLNFHFDLEDLEGEIEKLEKTENIKFNKKKLLKDLFIFFYKYYYVLFAETLAFKFYAISSEKFNSQEEICSFDLKFKRLLRVFKTAKKNIDNRNGNQYAASKLLQSNIYKSAHIEDSSTKLENLVNEIIEFSSENACRRKLGRAVYDAVKNEKLTTKLHNKIVRDLFDKTFIKLFEPDIDTNVNIGKKLEIQKNLSKKPFQKS
jgi:hypothetical protein